MKRNFSAFKSRLKKLDNYFLTLEKYNQIKPGDA